MSLHTRPAPTDFQPFWEATMRELAAYPAAAELAVMPLHTSDFATVYGVHFTSLGPYRIFAHFSVPHGEGPFPVLYHLPGYGSVVHVAAYEERQRYVTLALRHRGQRLADQPFAAAYPGLLTTGIAAPQSYVYRGIVADCCRAVDFLLSRPEVDPHRIAAVGGDLALMVAALRPQVDALICAPALFYAAETLAPRTAAYPLEELNDFARTYPDRAPAMWHTLSYFDPIHFAPAVGATTLLVSGGSGDLYAPEVVAPLAEALGSAVERVESAHSAYRDGVQQATWLAQRYGWAEPLLPPHWRPR